MDERAVEELYAAFDDVPQPGAIEGCPCCVHPDEGRRLLERPVRHLSADELGRYAAKALSTWGTPEDFRYFALLAQVEQVLSTLGR